MDGAARRRWTSGGLAALLLLAGAGMARAEGTVADLLPKGKDEAACFAATLPTPAAMALEDWSDTVVTSEEVPGLLDPSGKPVTRPVPLRSTGQVSGLVLSIGPDDLNESEPFRFLLSVTLDGRRRALKASGPCNVFDPVETGLREGTRGTTTALGCAVECDGGSVAVERAGGEPGLSVTFDHGGLRMTPGCSDEEEAFYLKAKDQPTTFVLAPAPQQACRALRAWDKDQ